MVSHKPKEKEDSPWSILVLDKEFNLLNEFKMDDSKYAYYGLMCSKGLLISNYYETLNEPNHFIENSYALHEYK